MRTPQITLMRQALVKVVSIGFDSEAEARSFRFECYRQRRDLRLSGIHDFDCLSFHIIHHILTIVAKKNTIREIA